MNKSFLKNFILFYFKRKMDFKSFSCVPKNFRYITSKQVWFAFEMGLYQDLLKSNYFFKKNHIVRTLSNIKRFEYDDQNSENFLREFLVDSPYKFYKKVIKEFFHRYPDFFFDFISKNDLWKRDIYFGGIFISYMTKREYDLYYMRKIINDMDDINKFFLMNNIMTDTKKRIDNFNFFLYKNKLLPIDVFDINGIFNISNIKSNYFINNFSKESSLVTILVTAYDAEDTIDQCLKSLLNQTWNNLEIIVINDASTDRTLDIIQEFERFDTRIKVVNLKRNVGTFAAKMIGVRYANGEYLTCQDSDDWAHPQKIENQVLPLINDVRLIATVSYWLRLDESGYFYARQYYPLLRQNPASPLFRRVQVEKEVGLWHVVRTGADSEFLARLELFYGKDRLYRIKLPLTLASHRRNSLMNSKEFGVHDKKSAINRLDYLESWRLWHIDCVYNNNRIYMPNLNEQIRNNIFDIPKDLLVDMDDVGYNLNVLNL